MKFIHDLHSSLNSTTLEKKSRNNYQRQENFNNIYQKRKILSFTAAKISRIPNQHKNWLKGFKSILKLPSLIAHKASSF